MKNTAADALSRRPDYEQQVEVPLAQGPEVSHTDLDVVLEETYKTFVEGMPSSRADVPFLSYSLAVRSLTSSWTLQTGDLSNICHVWHHCHVSGVPFAAGLV